MTGQRVDAPVEAMGVARDSHTGDLRQLLTTAVVLCVWLGAVAYFIAVVAPAAFRALPSRTLAGALVGQTLPAIFVSGIVAGALVCGLAFWGGPAAPSRGTRLLGGAIVALLCAVAQFVIGTRIDRLLAAMVGGPDALPAGDPHRVAFGRLHALSVASLGLAALVAIVVLAVTLASIGRQVARGA